MMSCLAIIPARSGSKRLKDKNIKLFNGKPLISYSIDAAIKSKVFDEIMVSTDSEMYSKISKDYGASVPFLRSERNSSDSASSWEMVNEVLDYYKKNNVIFDSFCLLQPTSPLRSFSDIINAFEVFKTSKVAVVSVCESEHPPLLCNILPEDLSLSNFLDLNKIKENRLKKFYRLNGAIYFVNIQEFLLDNNIYRIGSKAFIMDRYHSVDIDTEEDFRLAELIMKNNI